MATDPRILLCLSDHPGAQAAIQHAARLAVEQQAELYALHVEQPGAGTRRTADEAAQLGRNKQLAHDCGAQLAVVQHHRVAATLLRFAHEQSITTIVLGRSARPAWQRRICAGLARTLSANSQAQVVEVAHPPEQ